MRVLLLLITGLIFINLGGTNVKTNQTIPEREGERIVGIASEISRYNTITSPRDIEINKGSNDKPAKESRQNRCNINGNIRTNKQTVQKSYVSQQTIKSYARKHRISETRFYNLIIKESGGNVYARSPRGKYEGLGQWYRPYYNNQARVWGYVPNIYNANQHLEVTARAISEGQEFRWQNTY